MSWPAIEVDGLTFCYRAGESPVLRGLSFRVEPGTRCLLAGPNGAGKTTLLRVLAGRHMIDADDVRVLGRAAFHDTSLAADIDFLGGRFDFEQDVRVGAILDRFERADPERRRRLIEVLGIDLDWRMHAVSGGQRRRVQLLLGLIEPRRLLLLDEISTDLDLLARQDLLAFLREESDERQTTIVYASHILDRLERWATHLAYLDGGELALYARLEDVPELVELIESGDSAPILTLLERWMKRSQGGRSV